MNAVLSYFLLTASARFPDCEGCWRALLVLPVAGARIVVLNERVVAGFAKHLDVDCVSVEVARIIR